MQLAWTGRGSREREDRGHRRVCSERSISFVQEEGQREVEVGILWEIASWGMISSSVATEVDHEPFFRSR